MNDNPFLLTLHKTYYRTGFFNVPVQFDHHVRQVVRDVDDVGPRCRDEGDRYRHGQYGQVFGSLEGCEDIDRNRPAAKATAVSTTSVSFRV